MCSLPISSLPPALLARLCSYTSVLRTLNVLAKVNKQFNAATQHNNAYARVHTIETQGTTLLLNGHRFRSGKTAEQRKHHMIGLARFLLHHTEHLRVLKLEGKGCSVVKLFGLRVPNGVTYIGDCKRLHDANSESVRTFKVDIIKHNNRLFNIDVMLLYNVINRYHYHPQTIVKCQWATHTHLYNSYKHGSTCVINSVLHNGMFICGCIILITVYLLITVCLLIVFCLLCNHWQCT